MMQDNFVPTISFEKCDSFFEVISEEAIMWMREHVRFGCSIG